jgi:long-chain fatty acid transport protein
MKSKYYAKWTRGSAALATVAMLYAMAAAQVINFPVGSPVSTSGAGNARTDADNFFLHNNVAGMTEIPLDGEIKGKWNVSAIHRWRFNTELQLATFNSTRERVLPGPGQGITSETRLGTPGLTSEATYTSENQKFALGLGTYTLFGFQSKLKDPAELGQRAMFFDTRVASNDFAIGSAVRAQKKLSIGGSFIFGRGFVDLAQPNLQLAVLGIARQDRLDVSAVGAPGISVGFHFRPTERLSFGINYKTRRSYDLEGSLEAFTAVPTPDGIRNVIVAVKPQVTVKLKLPAIAEGGFEVKATRRLRLFADFRFYDYTATFQQIDVKDRQSGQTLVALKLDAYDVRSFRSGGIYALREATRLQFGLAYTNAGFPAAAISPGTMNVGGFDISGGISQRLSGGYWLNISVAGILGRERNIGPPENSVFPGKYGGRGLMLGTGLRW